MPGLPLQNMHASFHFDSHTLNDTAVPQFRQLTRHLHALRLAIAQNVLPRSCLRLFHHLRFILELSEHASFSTRTYVRPVRVAHCVSSVLVAPMPVTCCLLPPCDPRAFRQVPLDAVSIDQHLHRGDQPKSISPLFRSLSVARIGART